MLRKPGLYNKAILLRKRGFSYNEILKYLPVAESTISRWCRSVPLTKKQKERLVEKKRNTPFIRSLRKQAIRSEKEAKIWAKEQVNKISKKDGLLLAVGIILYWAEGTKRSRYKSIEFTNTDPNIISIMMKFFREIFHIPENKFRIMVRIGSRGDVGKAENYWSKLTKVPKKQFNKAELLKLLLLKNLRKNCAPVA